MPEKRRYHRVTLAFYLRVFNLDTGNLLGHAVDFSTGGLMLATATPLKPGQQYQIGVELFMVNGSPQTLAFTAESIWNRKSEELGSFHSGLRFLALSPATRTAIQSYLDQLPGPLSNP